MNFISLEPSPQQPNLNQKKVYFATKTSLGAFMIVSFLVLLKSKFESRTDTIVEPYVIHGKVSEVSTFLLPDLLQQKKTSKSKVCADWYY